MGANGFQYSPLESERFQQKQKPTQILKTVRVQAHAGSNPALPATKETSSVYQDMRGFLFV